MAEARATFSDTKLIDLMRVQPWLLLKARPRQHHLRAIPMLALGVSLAKD
jgi:hypothetical protein